MRLILIICLLSPPAFAQESQIGVIGSMTHAPKTGTSLNWQIRVEGILDARRTTFIAGVGLGTQRKLYLRENNRGTAEYGTAEARLKLPARLFLIGGARFGQVRFQEYRKGSANAYAGVGVNFSNRHIFTYRYLFRNPEQATIASLNFGNENALRGSQFGYEMYLPQAPGSKWRITTRVAVEFFTFFQSIGPDAGRHRGQSITFGAGLSRSFVQ